MWLPWRARRRTSEPRRALSDPAHPARRWIDVTAIAADRHLEVGLQDGRPVLQTTAMAAQDILGALDLAVAAAPDDADLLAARAAAHALAGDTGKAAADVAAALKIDPAHAEATAMQRHRDAWNSVFFLPAWSAAQREIGEVVAAAANRGDILHPVRFGIEAALLVLLPAGEAKIEAPPRRAHWQAFVSRTPYGPIGVHYTLIDIGGQVRRQEAMLGPDTAGRGNPAPLLDRLAGLRTCFVALADPTGAVKGNIRLDLPASTRAALGELSAALAKAAGSPADRVKQAIRWHTENFDMESIRFPD